jgi:hypothetical protein
VVVCGSGLAADQRQKEFDAVVTILRTVLDETGRSL